MRISARADYAVRAVLELAVRQAGGPAKAEAIAAAQDIPHKFLEGILGDLRRGGSGGYRLARAPDAITVADVIRTVDGPIVSVRGERPTQLALEDLPYVGAGRDPQRQQRFRGAGVRERTWVCARGGESACMASRGRRELSDRP
ncbi:Rrf2 family transcriptional regulator [Streptomyces sp. R41]|uniref:Rrf2 family transcriptional regulator n=1 Tax=Streptomyces sp. R41 TaxID=3238632 RepID=A0AB39REX2_9ACTN